MAPKLMPHGSKLYNTDMSKLIEYDEASPEVRAVYDDIRATRKSDFINNFWKQ